LFFGQVVGHFSIPMFQLAVLADEAWFGSS
jgi:hypothetical protein